MAQQKLLKLTIARVDGPLFDGEVVSVTVPGASGEMTLLAEHAALISPLKKKAPSLTEKLMGWWRCTK